MGPSFYTSFLRTKNSYSFEWREPGLEYSSIPSKSCRYIILLFYILGYGKGYCWSFLSPGVLSYEIARDGFVISLRDARDAIY